MPEKVSGQRLGMVLLGPGYTEGDTVKEKCSDISSLKKAQILLQEGHVYLDRDNDGRACERFFDFK